MAVTKEKVISIDTSGAVRNVEQLTKSFVPLRQQIKQLRDQLAQLEVGSEEFNKISKELADLQQKQIEITEAAKYSNRDFGAVMSSLTKVSMGLVGGINAVSSSLALLGQNDEDIQKVLTRVTLLMSIIQGFSAIDDAIKSLEGLKNAFSDLGNTKDIAQIETIKKEVNSIPDKKTIKIVVDGKEAEIELTTLKSASNDLSDAQNKVATSNDNIKKSSKGITGILKGVATGFKNAALAVKSFVASNPLLSALMGIIAGIGAGIAYLNKRMEESGRIAKEQANLLTNVNAQYREQNIRLQVLLNTAKNENESLQERKKAVEELNKIVPKFNANIEETTGLFVGNNKALKDYISNLKQKITLEAYEGKIKEYLQERLKLEEEINELKTSGWFMTDYRIRKKEEQINEIDQNIERLFGKIGELDLSKALDENKVENTVQQSGNKVVQVVKSITDAFSEMKKVANDAWTTMFESRNLDRIAKGLGNQFLNMRDEIDSVMNKYNLKDVFTGQFDNFLKKGNRSDYSDMFGSGLFGFGDVLKEPNIFDIISKDANELAKELMEINEKLKNKSGNLTAEQTLIYEKDKKDKESYLQTLNQEMNGYKMILESVNKYRDAMNELWETTVKEENSTILYNRQLEIQKKYRDDLFNGNYLANTNRNIAMQESEIESIKRLNGELEKRKTIINSDKNLQVLFANEVKRINQQILDNEKDIANREIQLEIDKYNKRLEQAKNYYKNLEYLIGEKVDELDRKNFIRGLGGSAYNTDFRKQKLIFDSIKSEMDSLEDSRKKKLIGEQEYNDKMLALKSHLAEEEKKLDDLRVTNAINAVQTYVGVFNSITGQISNILQTQMDSYDQNSEEYKQLQIANSWITTLSGSLSAFMSGFQSGLPWPANLILAGVLGGTTFATGVAQINNMKSGNHSNALTTGASNVGNGTYETIAYQQQSELIGNVKEQKVFVLENDISKVQNKVKVRESSITY